MESNSLNNFKRGPPKDHFCQVWLESIQWFRRRCNLKLWTDRRRRRMVTHHNSSPGAFGSGELKRLRTGTKTLFKYYYYFCQTFIWHTTHIHVCIIHFMRLNNNFRWEGLKFFDIRHLLIFIQYKVNASSKTIFLLLSIMCLSVRLALYKKSIIWSTSCKD